jgi:hypothetical protein
MSRLQPPRSGWRRSSSSQPYGVGFSNLSGKAVPKEFGHLLTQPAGCAGASRHGGCLERELKAPSEPAISAYLAKGAQRINRMAVHQPSQFREHLFGARNVSTIVRTTASALSSATKHAFGLSGRRRRPAPNLPLVVYEGGTTTLFAALDVATSKVIGGSASSTTTPPTAPQGQGVAQASSVIKPKNRSTRLIQEADVGVEWR